MRQMYFLAQATTLPAGKSLRYIEADAEEASADSGAAEAQPVS